eukprot:Nitzschia sp. Nitz4//scaffold90_size81538//70775//72369//NITZ4_005328-RA/size81538-augustus-gene-0.11-mRNA-1//1//CDS//3329560038//9292//frame0
MVFCVSPDTDGSTPSSDQGFNLSNHNVTSFTGCWDINVIASDDESESNRENHASSPQSLIAEALQTLTLEERGQVYDDIHGIDTRAEEAETLETPAFLEKHLHFFEEELQLLKLMKQGSPEQQALEMAEQQDKEFVQDRRLRLACLRTRDWDVNEAVASFMKYFDLKLYLFGSALLTKYLSIEHLTPKEIAQISKGYCQVLPNRDRAGRAILVWLSIGQDYDSVESLARQVFVMLPLDIESQRRGVSMVSVRATPYTIQKGSPTKAMPVFNRLISDFPLRLVSHHFCLPETSPITRPMGSLLLAVVRAYSQHNKARLRMHIGSYIEWCYALMPFGIPVHLLPLTNDLKVKNKNHREFLDMCSRAALSSNIFDAILLPTNRDLLLGKGKPIQQSPGNVIWSEFLEALIMRQPDLSSPMMYTGLAKQVVEHIHKYKGRILSKDSGVWEAVSDDVAQERIASMMRNRRFRRRHQG